MRILLINPSCAGLYGKFVIPEHPPIGLAYIGAVLKERGHDVSILDIDADRIGQEELIDRLTREKIDLVGIMALTPTYKSALSTAKIVKKASDVKVVFGGIHPTLMPAESIQPDEVDFVVVGEGEDTAVELVDAIEHNKGLGSVKGLVFKKDGKVIFNEKRPLIENLDNLPFPGMDLFESLNYTYPDAITSSVFPIITSRGCPGKCTYCNTNSIFPGKFRARSAKNVVDEIEALLSKYHTKEVHIWDDNFVTLKRRVHEIRDEIVKRGISVKFAFPNGLRADFLDRETLTALKEMGTYSIAVGIESGDEGVLRSVKKNIKLDTVKHAFKITKELGIETWGFFMIGLPSDTAESINRTIDFAIELDPDIAKFHVFKPYPGTEAFDELLQKNLIDDKDFSNYGIHTKPVHHLEGLSSNDIYELQNKAYRKFYLRPSKIFTQILRVRSMHRMRANVRVAVSLLRKMLER